MKCNLAVPFAIFVLYIFCQIATSFSKISKLYIAKLNIAGNPGIGVRKSTLQTGQSEGRKEMVKIVSANDKVLLNCKVLRRCQV